MCNGAEGSGAMPQGLGRCYRVWNGGGGLAAVFISYNTFTETGMLPESLRHRFRAFKRKEKPWCLTWAVDGRQWSEIENHPVGKTPPPLLRKEGSFRNRNPVAIAPGTDTRTSVFSVALW